MGYGVADAQKTSREATDNFKVLSQQVNGGAQDSSCFTQMLSISYMLQKLEGHLNLALV